MCLRRAFGGMIEEWNMEHFGRLVKAILTQNSKLKTYNLTLLKPQPFKYFLHLM